MIEVMTPRVRLLPPGETLQVFDASEDRRGIDEVDIATQRSVSHHFRRIDGRFELASTPFRFVWPWELDLMAQLAGMTLRERWGGWTREAFTSESRQHVSVWEKRSG